MLKYGLKIWSTNKEWFKAAVDLFKQGKIDFGEIYIVPDSFELNDLEVLKQMPFSVHSPHYTHNFNLFALTDEKLRLFRDQVVKTADFLNSQFIILHPGVGDNKEDFRENAFKIFDKRILIETMSKIGFVGQGGRKIKEGVLCFGHSLEQLKFIHKDCGFGVCLDFAHSAASAVSQGIKYKDFIKSLIDNFHPCYFHVSGGRQQSEEDEHLNVFEGDLDMKWFKGILIELAKSKDIYLVFETPKKGEKLANDLKNIEYLKALTSV